MKILARYLVFTFLQNFLFSALGLTVLVFFSGMLDQLLGGSYPAEQVLIFHGMQIPEHLVRMTPPSVLMATVLTLSGLNRSNELVACHSIGVSLPQLMSVIFILVFMISCFIIVIQDRILPPLFKQRTNFYWHEMKKRSDFYLDLKRDKIWYRSGNVIFNLRSFDPKSDIISGMKVYTFDHDFKLTQVVEANQAHYQADRWYLKDGIVTVFSGEDGIPITKGFSEKELKISEKPKDFQEIEKEVEGLRIKELYRYISRTKKTGVDTKGYEVKLHYRLSLSFIPLVMCMLAVPFSVRRRREGGVAKDLGICLGVTFGYWLFYSVSLNLGENGSLPPIMAAWLPSVVFLGLAVFMLMRKPA